MPTYSYSAVDSSGKRITGNLEAPNREVVVSTLQERDLIITKISEGITQPLKVKGASQPIVLIPQKVTSEDLMIFTRELSTMVGAGLPLVECLYTLAEDIENTRMKKIIQDLGAKLISGVSFSEALKNYPDVFNYMFVNLIKVGEMSGSLDKVLIRLAEYIEASESLSKRIKSALYYPVAVLTFAFLVVSGLFVFVIPRFAEIYSGFGDASLPGPTKFFLDLSQIVKQWFLLIVILLAVGIYVFLRLLKTNRGQLWFDAVKLSLPIIGSIVRKIVVARFARTLALLYSSGVPINESLDMVASSCGNLMVEKAVLYASEQIMEGARITGTLEKSKIFPNMVIHMIDVGERTGTLADMLNKISEFYDVQVNSAIDGLTSLIEPILIVSLGVFIAIIAIALFLPIVKLPSMIK